MVIRGKFTRLDEPVRFWSENTPSSVATVLRAHSHTYQSLLSHVDRLAAALLAMGIERGDRVAVMQTPHPDFLISLLAVTSVGAIWVGLNPKYRLMEMMHVLEDSKPRLLITRSRALERNYSSELERVESIIPSIQKIVIFDGDLAVGNAEYLSEFTARRVPGSALQDARTRVRPEDPCVLVYTSGSTGKPKGALLTHAAILSFATIQNEIWPVNPLRSLNYFPINHVGSIVDVSLPCLVAGGAIVFCETFEPAETLRLIREQEISLVGSVPSAYQLQLADPIYADQLFASCQLLVWEGAAMPADVIERLLRLNKPLATNYNMTEASAITALEPTRDLGLLSSTVGSPLPGVTIRLVKADGTEAPLGEPGEVWVKSESNFIGYWNQPAATRDVFSNGFFKTGDLAIRRHDGRYELIGRVKEMYKSGGYNVYPREVEAVIESHPSVKHVAVVPAPDPLWQEVGVAFIVLKPGKSIDNIEAWTKDRLANYKCPKRYLVRQELPLLPIGKVDKQGLKRALNDG